MMSINNISLPNQLLADFYKHVLVQDTATAMPVKEEITFLGKNNKQILILVNKKDTAYLPGKELTFLTNVLLACQLYLTDVAIVNWATIKNKNVQVLLKELEPRHLLLIDMDNDLTGFESAADFTIQTAGNIDYVSTPSLALIEKSVDAKRQLWTAVKKLFCI